MKNLRLVLALMAAVAAGTGFNGLRAMDGRGGFSASSSASPSSSRRDVVQLPDNTGEVDREFFLSVVHQTPYPARYYPLDFVRFYKYADSKAGTTSDTLARLINLFNETLANRAPNYPFTDPQMIQLQSICTDIANIVEHLNDVSNEPTTMIPTGNDLESRKVRAFLHYVAQITLSIIHNDDWIGRGERIEELAMNIERKTNDADDAAGESFSSSSRNRNFLAEIPAFDGSSELADRLNALAQEVTLESQNPESEFNFDLFFAQLLQIQNNVLAELRRTSLDIMPYLVDRQVEAGFSVESSWDRITEIFYDGDATIEAKLARLYTITQIYTSASRDIMNRIYNEDREDFRADASRTFGVAFADTVIAAGLQLFAIPALSQETGLTLEQYQEIMNFIAFCTRINDENKFALFDMAFNNKDILQVDATTGKKVIHPRNAALMAITLLKAGYVGEKFLSWALCVAITLSPTDLVDGVLRRVLFAYIDYATLSAPEDFINYMILSDGENQGSEEYVYPKGSCRRDVGNQEMWVVRGSNFDARSFNYFLAVCALRKLKLASEQVEARRAGALAELEERRQAEQEERIQAAARFEVQRRIQEQEELAREAALQLEQEAAAERHRVERQQHEDELIRLAQEEMRMAERAREEARRKKEFIMMAEEDEHGLALRGAEKAEAAIKKIQKVARGYQGRKLAKKERKEKADRRRAEDLANARATLDKGFADMNERLSQFGRDTNAKINAAGKRLEKIGAGADQARDKTAERKRIAAEKAELRRQQEEEARVQREEVERLVAERERKQAEEARLAEQREKARLEQERKEQQEREERERFAAEQEAAEVVRRKKQEEDEQALRDAAATQTQTPPPAAPVRAQRGGKRGAPSSVQSASGPSSFDTIVAAQQNAVKEKDAQADKERIESIRAGTPLDTAELAKAITTILATLPRIPDTFDGKKAYFEQHEATIVDVRYLFNKTVEALARIHERKALQLDPAIIPASITADLKAELKGFEFEKLEAMMRK